MFNILKKKVLYQGLLGITILSRKLRFKFSLLEIFEIYHFIYFYQLFETEKQYDAFYRNTLTTHQ